MWLLLLFFILLALGTTEYLLKKTMRHKVKNIPGPKNIPLLGALWLIFKLDVKGNHKTQNQISKSLF